MQSIFFILLLLDEANCIDGMSFNTNDFIHDFFFYLIISVIVHHGYNELSCHLGLTSLQMVFGSKPCLFFAAFLGELSLGQRTKTPKLYFIRSFIADKNYHLLMMAAIQEVMFYIKLAYKYNVLSMKSDVNRTQCYNIPLFPKRRFLARIYKMIYILNSYIFYRTNICTIL